MKKFLKITVCMIIVLLSFNQMNAQGCENTVTNGSFKDDVSGWTNTHVLGTLWQHEVDGIGRQVYADVGPNSSSTLSQAISNVAVDNGHITVLFTVRFDRYRRTNYQLQVTWNGTEYLRFNNNASNPEVTVSTYNTASYTRSTATTFDDGMFHITLKIPHAGVVPSNGVSGTISFIAMGNPGQTGTRRFWLDNVFIPRHGCAALSSSQPSFDCEPGVGYIVQNNPNPVPEGIAQMYKVNLATGSNTLVSSMLINSSISQFSQIQAIGYNVNDDYIWGVREGTNQIVRIGSDYSVEFLTIPNLPNRHYASGDIDANGIYYLGFIRGTGAVYESKLERIDLNTATCLAPLEITGIPVVDFIDFAINPWDNNIYAVRNTRELIRINPNTGVATVVGTYDTDQLPTTGFGAVFFDNEGSLFTSSNSTGKIYKFSKVHLPGTPSVTFWADGPSTNSNDGARCPYTPVPPVINKMISGKVWNDADGDAVIDAIGEPYLNTGTNNYNGLWANLISSSGEVVQSVPVHSNGSYTLYTSTNDTYSIVLTNEEQEEGDPLSSSTLPTTWVNTGTRTGGIANNTNKTGVISGVTISTSTGDIDNLDFGIQRVPNSHNKTFNAGIPNQNSMLPLNGISGNAPLMSGEDPEDGSYTGNSGAIRHPNGVYITSLPSNGELYYNGNLVTATDINNQTLFTNPALFSVKFIPGNYTIVQFSYSYVDAAGSFDPTPATYTIQLDENPLIVDFIYFGAALNNNYVLLSWMTASEQNNKGFAIERSADARSWEAIGFVNTLAENGTSNSELNYTYADPTPHRGDNYYRLKQIDFDGQFEYSVVKVVTFSEVSAIQVYPNPAKDYITINGLKGSEVIKLYDGSGRTVRSIRSSGNILTIELNGLSEGVYYVSILLSDGKTETRKIVKLK